MVNSQPRSPAARGSCACRASLILLAVAAGIAPALADTFYVRVDGGNASECDGRVDVPYPGVGRNRACAWKHPFIALPPGGQPRIEGGDTLIIGSGSYAMGLGAPGSGDCHPAYSWDCHMPALPAGADAAHPTLVLGAGHEAGCTSPPVLWGTERASVVLNLAGTEHAKVACLEITDRSPCIEFHCHAGGCGDEILACERERPPFGRWASTGIFASDADDILLIDLHVHGLAGRGIQAGRIADWHIERVRIEANGWAGWDGDIGGDSGNSGRIHFLDVDISYNGCAESWPEREIRGCWAQGAGGYGDGLGTAATGGEWVFDRVRIHHNTSDGLDLAYLETESLVKVRRSLFEGNAGNQVKIAGSATISNSIVVGNCAHFAGHGNFADSDHCRAGGDAIFLGLAATIESRLVNNSITGEGNCLVSSAGEAGGRLVFANNLFVGQPAHARGRASCHFHTDQREAEITWRNNVSHGVHDAICSVGNACVYEVAIASTDLDGFDPTPQEDGPLFGASRPGYRLGHDFWGFPRSARNPHVVGAIGPLGRSRAMEALRNGLRRPTGGVGQQAAR